MIQYDLDLAIGLEDKSADKVFPLSYMTLLTLKFMLSRSPKSNHFFCLSQISICASLVKIHTMVHKIEH